MKQHQQIQTYTPVATAAPSVLKTIPQFCTDNPAFTSGGIRHIQFTKEKELAEAGAVVRFGRKLLIDEQKFLDFVRSGGASQIAGKKWGAK
ncbi:MAG: hypothetical protein ACYCY3_02325 [Halothiobacillus sp.]